MPHTRRNGWIGVTLLACVIAGIAGLADAGEPAGDSQPSPPTVADWPVTPASTAVAPEPAPRTEAQVGPRFRFGIGFVSGEANQSVIGLSPTPTVLGLELRLGVQVNDAFAVMYQGSATVLWPTLDTGLLFEFTPTRSVSLAGGLGVDILLGPIDGDVVYGGLIACIPLRLAWNLVTSQGPGPRRALALSVDVSPGTLIDGASGFVLSVLGGISYELY